MRSKVSFMVQSKSFLILFICATVFFVIFTMYSYHHSISALITSAGICGNTQSCYEKNISGLIDPSQLLLDLKRTNGVQFIHQSWKTSKLPSRFLRWSKTWRKCYPDARHVLWTDKDNRDFIAKHYPWFLSRYDALPSAICRADAVRYLYLFHFGGIYSDLDNECLRPFEHLLKNATIVFGVMDGYKNIAEGYLQNSFMYSVARHPFWMELVHQIMGNQNNLAPELLTGPGVLAKVVNAYRKRNSDSKDITAYPPLYFNPFSWQKLKVKACKHFNLMSDKEMVECRNAFQVSSYVVQYHTHTWGGGKII